MKKIIIIDGEVLNNNVITNNKFDAIYKISPSILKYFIKLISKIDNQSSSVVIDNYTFPDMNSINIEFSNENLSGNTLLSFKMIHGMLELIDSNLHINDDTQSEIESDSNPEIEEKDYIEIKKDIRPTIQNKIKSEIKSDIKPDVTNNSVTENNDTDVKEFVNEEYAHLEAKETLYDEDAVATMPQADDVIVENDINPSIETEKDTTINILPETADPRIDADSQSPEIAINHDKVKKIFEAKRNGFNKSKSNRKTSSSMQEEAVPENNLKDEEITKVDITENNITLLEENICETNENTLKVNIENAVIDRPTIIYEENNTSVNSKNEEINITSPWTESPENTNNHVAEEEVVVEEVIQQEDIENMTTEAENSEDDNIDIDLIIETLRENKIRINKEQVEKIVAEYKKSEKSDKISEERLINYIKYLHGYDKKLALTKLSKLKDALEQVIEKEVSTEDVLNIQLKLLNKETEEKRIKIIDRNASVDLYQLDEDVSMSKDKIYLWGETLYLQE